MGNLNFEGSEDYSVKEKERLSNDSLSLFLRAPFSFIKLSSLQIIKICS